jgi:hypothetical protein
MVKAVRYAGKVYQSALRREVTRCGYRTVETKNERGQVEGFEIVGIPGDQEKTGAIPTSHRMSPASLVAEATASRAIPRSKHGLDLA